MSFEKLTFPSSPFHTDLKRRADAYFAEAGIEKAANRAMMLKTAFWLAFTWGNWALLLALAPSFPLSIVLWGLVGFGLACIGFNVGHDAIHGSYSKNKVVNAILSCTFDMMGASSYTWQVSHNVVHHTWTNIPGVDKDLEPGPTMRFYPQQTSFYHRFQQWYAWPLYGFTGFIWMYIKDFEQLLREDPRTGKRAPLSAIAGVFAGKAAHLVLFVVLPYALLHQPLWQMLLGYITLLFVAGVTLAVVFQLAHNVENVQFPKAVPGTHTMANGWAEHQLLTTANFGRSWLATFICGGLDHQIEHHLFPRVCHIHYPKLAPIVEQCAKEHGVPYFHSGTFLQAVGSHFRTLKRFGTGDEYRREQEAARAQRQDLPQAA